MVTAAHRQATRARRVMSMLILFAILLPTTTSFSTRPIHTSLSASRTSQIRPAYDIVGVDRCKRNSLVSVGTLKTKKQVATTLFATNAIAASTNQIGGISMILLCLQFAFQPVLTKSFASKSIQRGTYVLMQDVIRILMSLILLNRSLATAAQGWTIVSALQAAGIPSMLYLVQNICSLMAYQHLSPITYNVLNQTKTLSAAIFCYFLLGQKQSPQQMVALFLLVLAALIMEGSLGKLVSAVSKKSKTESPTSADSLSEDSFWTGVVPVLVASTTSGLAGALAQKSLQVHSRNAMIFNMELATCSIVIMSVTKVFQQLRQGTNTNKSETSKTIGSSDNMTAATPASAPSSMWTGWTKQTWIPLLTNAAGGLLVGLVTKYAGAVQKGFSLIFGMFLSGLLQNYMPVAAADASDGVKRSKKVTATQWFGGALAATSLLLHVSYPPTI
ncbi:hypothetical protein MPSEU_000443300 [Mayamaea pseudoterrestris]|nr:hypothetical protein MPSEU_000443300 [Mayamaea pseudoterrestris]